MIDCYRILDVPHSASPAEIRAAYLAKMKALHPDRSPADVAGPEASDITYAYWHLRDPDRRAEHDRSLFQFLPPARRRPPSSRRVATTRRRSAPKVYRRNSARLKRLRAAAGIGAFAIAGAAIAICFTYLPAGNQPKSNLVAAVEGGAATKRAPKERRKIDTALAVAAADEFWSILRRSGSPGAHQYLRQCHAELATAPSLNILDYCIAFENTASRWEKSVERIGSERYFADQQRLARYRTLSHSIPGGSTRDALNQEVDFLAAAGT